MSTNRARRAAKLRAEQAAITRRLERAVRPNMGGPVLGRATIAYELSERAKAVAHGGIGLIAKVIDATGLAGEIDASLELLKLHRPYHESDHVVNIAYNALCGGRRLEDIEARRQDAVFLDGLGVESLPDPTTAGDFCRRFDAAAVLALQEAVNRARLKVWRAQPPGSSSSRRSSTPTPASSPPALRPSRGWTSPTTASGGTRRSWSRSRTPANLVPGPVGANRPSHEGVIDYYDRAIALCRNAGFKQIRLRGDTDFALTTEFDRWDADGVRFVFGNDARAT